MAEAILLTQEHLRQLFRYDPETGNLYWLKRGVEWFHREQDMHRWNTCFAGRVAGGVRGAGHVFVAIQNRSYLVHRIIWAIVTGDWPKGEIDHINGNPADNRWSNLRDVSHKENQRNLRRETVSVSGCSNIYPQAGKYRVKVGRKHIGYFSDLSEAKLARDNAYRELGFHENHGKR